MRTNTNWIQSFTGKQFWPLDPKPQDVDILDIAHGLSMVCRFNGQCARFYSVAEHSVLVARALPGSLKLAGLLHDASEAYISDVAKPIKSGLVGYDVIERELQAAVYDRFSIDGSYCAEAVKVIDSRILIDEQIAVMGPAPVDWKLKGEPLGVDIECWSPAVVEIEFLNMFNLLYNVNF